MSVITLQCQQLIMWSHLVNGHTLLPHHTTLLPITTPHSLHHSQWSPYHHTTPNLYYPLHVVYKSSPVALASTMLTLALLHLAQGGCFTKEEGVWSTHYESLPTLNTPLTDSTLYIQSHTRCTVGLIPSGGRGRWVWCGREYQWLVTEVVITARGHDGAWGRVQAQCGLPTLAHVIHTYVPNEGHRSISIEYGGPTPQALARHGRATGAAVAGQSGRCGPRVGGSRDYVRRGEGGGGGRRV